MLTLMYKFGDFENVCGVAIDLMHLTHSEDTYCKFTWCIHNAICTFDKLLGKNVIT